MEKENVKKNRLLYLDVAKGIGIICVIAGHMGNRTLFRLTFPFHMPLFFLISGYFISQRLTPREYCCKKIKQLLPPYVFTCMCIVFLKLLVDVVKRMPQRIPYDLFWETLAALYGSGSDMRRMPPGIHAIGAVWFFMALFFALMIVRYSIEIKHGWIAVSVLAFVSYISSQYFWLPFSVQAGGTAAGFVYIGYLAKKTGFLENKVNWPVFAVGVLVFIYEYQNIIYVTIVDNGYKRGLFSAVAAILICYVVVCISKGIADYTRVFQKILCFYGENSLTVMCLHLLEVKYFPWGYVYRVLGNLHIPSIFSVFCVLCAKVVLCTIGVFIIQRTRYIRKIFGK